MFGSSARLTTLASPRILLSLALLLGVIGMQAGGGTLAFFTSTADSTGNTFTAGTVSLKVADTNEAAASSVAGSITASNTSFRPGQTVVGWIYLQRGNASFRLRPQVHGDQRCDQLDRRWSYRSDSRGIHGDEHDRLHAGERDGIEDKPHERVLSHGDFHDRRHGGLRLRRWHYAIAGGCRDREPVPGRGVAERSRGRRGRAAGWLGDDRLQLRCSSAVAGELAGVSSHAVAPRPAERGRRP